MNESPGTELTQAQIATLQRLLAAGFEFVTIEHVVRYLPVEKDGFAALIDPSGGKLRIFGEAGLRMGEGIGMLVETSNGKKFVWKSQTIDAPPELLERFARFKNKLSAIVEATAQ